MQEPRIGAWRAGAGLKETLGGRLALRWLANMLEDWGLRLRRTGLLSGAGFGICQVGVEKGTERRTGQEASKSREGIGECNGTWSECMKDLTQC